MTLSPRKELELFDQELDALQTRARWLMASRRRLLEQHPELDSSEAQERFKQVLAACDRGVRATPPRPERRAKRAAKPKKAAPRTKKPAKPEAFRLDPPDPELCGRFARGGGDAAAAIVTRHIYIGQACERARLKRDELLDAAAKDLSARYQCREEVARKRLGEIGDLSTPSGLYEAWAEADLKGACLGARRARTGRVAA